jgi:hypothetical protein
VRANRVLGDEESLGDLVSAEVLVEQQQHLDLAGREHACDFLGHTAQPSTVSHPLEEATGDTSRQRGVAACDAVEEGGDLFRRLRLEEVARRSSTDRGQEVLLGVRGG